MDIFFLLYKLLQFIIDPFTWIVFLLILVFLNSDYAKKKRFFISAVVLLFVFSNSFLFDECMRKWEVPATPNDSLKTYDIGIVLGGILSYDETLDRVQFLRGSDRLLQAIDLYKKGNIKKIVFTGGSGSVLHPDEKEGPLVERFLITLGIPKSDFLIEGESNNTRQNALYTKELLEKEGFDGSVLLITAAFHMRRSLGCFNKVGIVGEPYSVDRYSGKRKFEIEHLLLPKASTLDSFRNLIHEIVGYWVYKIVGYA